MKIKVYGKRVLIQSERIDVGGLMLTPTLEEEGKKNTGKIIAIGQIGLLAWLRGIRTGRTVHFKKYFTTNHESSEPVTFVACEDIVGISNS